MFIYWLIGLALATTSETTWLVKAPHANPHDFFVYAQNSHMAKVSGGLTSCSQKNKLQQLLKKGQYQFLDGSLVAAQNEFLYITNLKWDCDWNEDERKIISFSFFRLAQLSKSESEQMNYITEAINFDETLKPDAAIFPPPLIELYKKVLNQMEMSPIQLPENSNKFSKLLRNGRFINLQGLTTPMYSLRARFTFISDSYLPETVITTPQELTTRTLEAHPLVDGNCETFKPSAELLALGKYQIFFSSECIKSAPATHPSQMALVSPMSTPLEAATPFAPRKKSWLERNLLWVGVAVVSSIAVTQMIKNNQKDTTVLRPTNTLSE